VKRGASSDDFILSMKVSCGVGRTLLPLLMPRPRMPEDGESSVNSGDTWVADSMACVSKEAAPMATRSW
jgi:hypothetical protein